MANTNTPNVTITFDGLLSFDLDRRRKLCKIDIHTKAESHLMKILVKDNTGKTVIKKLLCQTELIKITNIRLYVAQRNGAPLEYSVSDSGSFDKILDLASVYFYDTKYPVNGDFYECSIWLQNGKIGAGQEESCFRVAQKDKDDKFFDSLKYDWQCRQEWEGFKRGVQSTDPEKMKEHPYPFARDVIAEITLEVGQLLKLVYIDNDNEVDIFEGKVAFGSDYDITIEYADAFLPAGLFDCQGFAHHSEALEFPEGEKKPIYGIFRPAKFIDEADARLNTITNPALCECVRNDGPTSTDLAEKLEKLPQFPSTVQPEKMKLLAKRKSNL
ncbi:MAG: hypothetical protein ACKVZH_28680 [Blastocatellia bacterium]